jgi:hypothetical protein
MVKRICCDCIVYKPHKTSREETSIHRRPEPQVRCSHYRRKRMKYYGVAGGNGDGLVENLFENRLPIFPTGRCKASNADLRGVKPLSYPSSPCMTIWQKRGSGAPRPA